MAVQTGRFMFPGSAGTYEGHFIEENGVKIAQGTGVYRDGHASYSGEFANNKPNGQGKYVAASGAVYEGQFANGAFEGSGQYNYPDGAVYNGEWKGNKMHGSGAFSAADGVQYVGQFYNGLYVSGNTHVAVR